MSKCQKYDGYGGKQKTAERAFSYFSCSIIYACVYIYIYPCIGVSICIYVQIIYMYISVYIYIQHSSAFHFCLHGITCAKIFWYMVLYMKLYTYIYTYMPLLVSLLTGGQMASTSRPVKLLNILFIVNNASRRSNSSSPPHFNRQQQQPSDHLRHFHFDRHLYAFLIVSIVWWSVARGDN